MVKFDCKVRFVFQNTYFLFATYTLTASSMNSASCGCNLSKYVSQSARGRYKPYARTDRPCCFTFLSSNQSKADRIRLRTGQLLSCALLLAEVCDIVVSWEQISSG